MGPFSKSRISRELMIILEDNCLACLRPFNETNQAPYCLFPCQHHICKECVDQKVAKSNTCPDCSKEVASKNIRKSNNLLRLVRIIKTIQQSEPKDNDEMKSRERQIAIKIIDQKIFYQCNQCSQPFDRHIKQPTVVCLNQHIICTECIKTKSFKVCPFCKQTILDDLIVSSLILNASEFIQKQLFSKRLKFVVNETNFNITTHHETTIKDIFFKLQNQNCISDQINIRKCQFMVTVEGEEKQQKADDFNLMVREFSKIEVLYDEKDMISGSHMLTPSRLFNQNAIKISNFKPISALKYIVDEDDEDEDGLGPDVKAQPSDLYPEVDPNEVKPFKIESLKMKNELSNHEKSLRLESKEREKYLLDEEEMSRAVKKSRIMNIKEQLIGTECPHNFIENFHTKLPPGKRSEVLKRFLNNHEINPDDEQLLCYQIEKAMNQPFSPEEISQSQKMETDISVKAQKGELMSMILKLLKDELQSGEMKVLYTPKSTIRSQLTLKIITSHYLRDRFIVHEVIDEDQKFFFQKFVDSEKATTEFLKFIKEKYQKRFDLEPQSIVFHKIIKGSLIVVFSINDGPNFTKYIKNNLDKNLSIHPYFTQLELSPEDFDQKGHIKFKQIKKDIQFRGGWPYYQPIMSERFGINVLGKFDDGKNVWLRMKNQPGEWVVGFHGVKHPNEAYNQYKNTIQSILAGLHKSNKKMLIDVENSEQAHVNSLCANAPGEIGRGVYLSPMFALCLQYAHPQKVGTKSYRLVFQCRLRPNSIKIPQQQTKQNIWVVNNSASIRPYGIVLIEDSAVMKYPPPVEQFGENFKYSKYKDRIEKGSMENISSASTS